MNVHVDPDLAVRKRHLPSETVALVLQGGGALGAYQAGVYEALAEADIHPNWSTWTFVTLSARGQAPGAHCGVPLSRSLPRT
jgi:hypothetical protein